MCILYVVEHATTPMNFLYMLFRPRQMPSEITHSIVGPPASRNHRFTANFPIDLGNRSDPKALYLLVDAAKFI